MPQGRPKGKKTKKNPKRPLTVKQQKFVEAIVQEGDPSKAVQIAGYSVKSEQSARSVANVMFQNPRIQTQIQQRIREMFPDAEETAVKRLHNIIKTGNDSNAIKAIAMFARIFGWDYPTKHISAKVNVNRLLDKYRLPE